MERTFIFRAEDERDTARLAGRLASFFGPECVVGLDGDLGAGKTAFSQAVARALGVTEVVNSPTFTIIKEYEGEKLPFYHMDVYRISLEEAEDLGLDEYFYGDGVTLVEWASVIEELLPEDRLSLYIEHDGGTRRTFRLAPKGDKYEAWCSTLKETGLLT